MSDKKLTTFVIATSKVPVSKELGIGFFHGIRLLSDDYNAKLGDTMHWTSGPGCTNLAFATDSEELVKAVCMYLMPARYSITNSPLPEEDTVDEILFKN